MIWKHQETNVMRSLEIDLLQRKQPPICLSFPSSDHAGQKHEPDEHIETQTGSKWRFEWKRMGYSHFRIDEKAEEKWRDIYADQNEAAMSLLGKERLARHCESRWWTELTWSIWLEGLWTCLGCSSTNFVPPLTVSRLGRSLMIRFSSIWNRGSDMPWLVLFAAMPGWHQAEPGSVSRSCQSH